MPTKKQLHDRVSTEFETTSSAYASQQPVSEVSRETVEKWISLEDRSNPITNDVDALILFDTGEVRRYNEGNWPDGIVTHWMQMPSIQQAEKETKQ